MHVLVVGAGAAGLGAAWKLMEAGVDVTVLEAAERPGGRCSSVYWHGDWRITGAMAFISAEENLKEQACKLGIYEDDQLVGMTELHAHDILVGRERVVSIPDFEPATLLKTSALPLKERIALGKVLPKVMKQLRRNDWRDPTPAAEFDDVTAAAFFRKHSPTFVDHLLEPVMQHFNGFSEDDYSLGWIVWVLAGLPWSSSWWSFKERGVGRLTWEMARQLDATSSVEVHYDAPVRAIRHDDGGAEVDVTLGGNERTLRADAVVSAVPGTRVNDLVPGLDPEYRSFFDAVRYGPLYLSYYLAELPEADLPPALILPTADGFHTTAYYNIQPQADGRAIVHAEMKGAASLAAKDESDEAVREELWADIVAATPAMAACRIEDFLLIRNDIAIVKPYVGYLTALKKFKTLPPLARLAFAGDYLITSTVGQAHYTGLRAAERILALQRH